MDPLHDEITAHGSRDMDEVPALSRFTHYIGEKFDVAIPDGFQQIELVEANAVSRRAAGQSAESFSLVFRAQHDCSLDQGAVALEHEKIGWLVLFLVSIGEDQNGRYFEAIID